MSKERGNTICNTDLSTFQLTLINLVTYIQTFVFTPTDAHTLKDLKISHRFCYKQKQQPQQKAKSSLRMSFSRTDCQKDGRTNGWMERLGSVWWVGGVVIK